MGYILSKCPRLTWTFEVEMLLAQYILCRSWLTTKRLALPNHTKLAQLLFTPHYEKRALQKVAQCTVWPFHHWVFFFYIAVTYQPESWLASASLYEPRYKNKGACKEHSAIVNPGKKEIQRARHQQSKRFAAANLLSSTSETSTSFSSKMPE